VFNKVIVALLGWAGQGYREATDETRQCAARALAFPLGGAVTWRDGAAFACILAAAAFLFVGR